MGDERRRSSSVRGFRHKDDPCADSLAAIRASQRGDQLEAMRLAEAMVRNLREAAARRRPR